jgi:TatD DNase family protein
VVKLVDTHSHIFVDEFDDLVSIMKQASEAQVAKILMPNIDEETIDQVIATHHLFPKETAIMMGLHPSSVKSDFKDQLAKIKTSLDNLDCCAVGEIGLDYYWSDEFKKEQLKALEIQLQWAIDKGLPVSLHTRNATSETIDICKNFKGLKGVFHCFGGSVEEAKQIIDLGMYLGIGGVVTFKNAGLAESLAQLDLSNLVLETDSPYLAPHPNRGKRNEPAYLKLVAQKLTEVFNTSFEEVALQTSRNAEKVFNFTL